MGLNKRHLAFWFSVSVIAALLLWWVFEWLQDHATKLTPALLDDPVDYEWFTGRPLASFVDRPITSFDLPAYRRAGLI